MSRYRIGKEGVKWYFFFYWRMNATAMDDLCAIQKEDQVAGQA